MLSKYLVSMYFKFEINFGKYFIFFYLLFIFLPVFIFSQQSNNLSSIDKLFTKWNNSNQKNQKNVLHLKCPFH